ncbi:hypothetical protein [Vibrio spartinae]|uniref:Uncharacterized protein n=1 Tax=Vibrio spartinae TaxID=1918945 RepID=A0ABX6R4I2_9VIBR|nr:hypothetical protein [Vibrio spartinae]QMV16416.1 hypothetical protein Vspart_03808 [Vibrio spartinae]
MNRMFFLFLLIVCFSSKASVCNNDVDFIEINSKYLSKEIQFIDPYSSEYVKRSYLIYPNGDMLVLNQKKCTMSNYEIVYYFSPDRQGEKYYKDIYKRYSDILNSIVKYESLIKNKTFDDNLYQALVTKKIDDGNYSFDRVKSDDNIEYTFSINSDLDDLDLYGIYRYKFITYIGIGGL